MAGTSGPPPPEDVRVLYSDGREIAVQCVYAGTDHAGYRVWSVVDAPDDGGTPIAMHIGLLPPMTTVRISGLPGRGY